jgi:phospholipid transport system substrate-binding protein
MKLLPLSLCAFLILTTAQLAKASSEEATSNTASETAAEDWVIDQRLPPEHLVVDLFSKLTKVLAANKEALKNDPEFINELAEKYLDPQVSYDKMAKQILGKNWKKITPKQQTQYTQAFQSKLARLMVEYYNPDMNYQMTISSHRYNSKKTLVVVNSDMLNTKDATNYKISYKLFHDKDQDKWMLYDIIGEGVSILQSFKKAAEEDFKKHGIEYMIDDLSNDKSEAAEEVEPTE